MGLIGSVWGLYITGTTINVVALIGLIMLAGIVVNNAIVLIDAINQARERGLDKHRGHQARRPHAPAPDPHHQRQHHHRPHADGDRHRRRRGDPPADGDHRDRRHDRRDFLTLIVIPVLYALIVRERTPARRRGRGA